MKKFGIVLAFIASTTFANPWEVTQPYVSADFFVSSDSDNVDFTSMQIGYGSYVKDSGIDRFGIKYGPIRYTNRTLHLTEEGSIRMFTWAKEYGKHTLEGGVGNATLHDDHSIGYLQLSGPLTWFEKSNYEMRYERGIDFVTKYDDIDLRWRSSDIVSDMAYVNVDKEFNDRWAGSVMVGGAWINDEGSVNHKLFTKSKLSYYILPNYGISTFVKVKTQQNSMNRADGDAMPYYAPKHMIEGVGGLQYRKFFRQSGSVFTASIEAGRQSTEYASNDTYGAELKYESYLTNSRSKWQIVAGHKTAAGGKTGDPDYRYNYIFGYLIIPF